MKILNKSEYNQMRKVNLKYNSFDKKCKKLIKIAYFGGKKCEKYQNMSKLKAQ